MTEPATEEEKETEQAKEETNNEAEKEEEELPQAENDTTLFIKNLNFTTTEDSIKEVCSFNRAKRKLLLTIRIQHFAKCGKILSVTVAQKKDSKNPGKMLSMGYGFLQFFKKNSADKALKNLQNSSLDGHAIELKRSNRTLQ
jgi:multiple RNA-binding domain-containing protein 1